jgi:hypothetical protein
LVTVRIASWFLGILVRAADLHDAAFVLCLVLLGLDKRRRADCRGNCEDQAYGAA